MSELVITPSAPKIAGLPVLKASDRLKFRNLLVYGNSGIGKTQLIGSSDEVPELRKVLMMDAEGGSMTLEHSYPNVDIVRVTNWKQVAEVIQFLENSNHDYSTLCLDSLTELQKFNMYSVLVDPRRKDERDPDVADMHDWGKNLEQMRRFVRRVRDMPMHTLFTALVSEDKDKTGKTLIKPGFPGKLRNEIAAFLDIVCYMYMKEVPDPADSERAIQQRMLLTGSTDLIIAKDRSNNLPMVMVNPTMKDIFELTA
jgi:AAA domain-containing protein